MAFTTLNSLVTRSGKGAPLNAIEHDANINSIKSAVQELQSVLLGGVALTLAAVTITGGSINGTAIGSTTPAAASFTSIKVGNSSSSDFIGIAGDDQYMRIHGSNAINQGAGLILFGGTSAAPNIGRLMSGSTITCQWDASGINGVIGATTPAAGTFTGVASTVNTADGGGMIVTNSSTGTYATIHANGATAYGVSSWVNSLVIESVSAGSGGLVLGSYTGPITFQTNLRTLTPLVITQTGNLGIAESSPSARLHAKGSTSDNSAYALKIQNSTPANLLVVRNDGNVGIGPVTNIDNAKLLVYGDISTDWGASNTFIGMRYVAGADYELGMRLIDSTRETRLLSKAADGAGFVSIYTGATPAERLRIDAAGNLGLGVVPSAWNSVIRGFELGKAGTGIWGQTNASVMSFVNNSYYDAVGWKYANNGYATVFQTGSNGDFSWQLAPSGTAGNAITFTQAMTLASTGNLLIGTASEPATSARMVVVGSTADGSTDCLSLFDSAGSAGTPVFKVNTNGVATSASYISAPLGLRSAAAGNDVIFGSLIAGDGYYRYQVDASGTQYWGSGAVAYDTNLYRSAANTLKTDDAFVSGGIFTVGSSDATSVLQPGGSNTHITMRSLGTAGCVRFFTQGGDTDVYATTETARFDTTGKLIFGADLDTNLYRSAANVLKTDDKLLTALGLGVGNSAAATTLGSVAKKMEVFDASGASLGYVAIYDAIT